MILGSRRGLFVDFIKNDIFYVGWPSTLRITQKVHKTDDQIFAAAPPRKYEGEAVSTPAFTSAVNPVGKSRWEPQGTLLD
jgi:hypothetical protein